MEPRHLGSALRAARRSKRLSQAWTAEAAKLTQAHVSMLERGLDAHISVVQKLARSLGYELTLRPIQPESDVAYPDDDIAQRIYLIGCLAARRISSESLKEFRSAIQRARQNRGDYPYFRRWLKIIADGPDAVATLFRDRTEDGRYMRAVVSMRPFVSQAERDSFYRGERSVRE